MKKYVVLYGPGGEGDGTAGGAYFDSLADAEHFRHTCECVMNIYAELYERVEIDGCSQYRILWT